VERGGAGEEESRRSEKGEVALAGLRGKNRIGAFLEGRNLVQRNGISKGERGKKGQVLS